MELSMNTNVLLLCCWFRTSITRHVACYPGQLTCYPGIHPWGVRAAAACSPRDNSDQGIVKVVLECDEWTPAVTLARVPDVTDVLGSVPRKVPGRAGDNFGTPPVKAGSGIQAVPVRVGSNS